MLSISATFDRAIRQLGGIPPDMRRAKKRAARQLRRRLEKEAIRHVARKLGTTQKAWRAGNPGTRGKRVFVRVTRAGGLQMWVGTNPMLLHYLGRLRWNRGMAGVQLTRRAGLGKQIFEDSFLIDSRYRRRKLAFRRRYMGQRLPIDPVTSDDLTIDREAQAALADFAPDVAELWEEEVFRAVNAELRRSGTIGAQSIT
jgi:hypothetical protein